jgi:branched-chain amino acid transport system substrate-binding protein
LVVSDLPMRGDSAERSRQQVAAIRIVLRDAGWKAGKTTLGFQACDDSIAKTGLWDEATCHSNAQAYAKDERVLGVIGTYNSGCAAIEIPILNEAPLAIISPGNTAVCLTLTSPTCEEGQPQSLYPSGDRNYARVVPNDAFQGAALAEFAQGSGVKRPFVLYTADDSTSIGQATNFRGAAEALGMRLAGYRAWDPDAAEYKDLMQQVDRAGADAVVLAGLTEHNGAQVIEDKVAVLGDNEEVSLIAYDGLAQQSTIDEAGSASRGMFAGSPGRPPDDLTGDGKTLVTDLESDLGGEPVEQFAPYAGEAAAVLLKSIAAAGEDRAVIVKAVLEDGDGGIVGAYHFRSSGDPNVGPVTVLKAGSTFEPTRVIAPPAAPVVAAARG